MGMEQPPEPEPNENDTPDDGLAIAAIVVSVLVCGILVGLAWLSHFVGLM